MIKVVLCIGYIIFVSASTVARPRFLANNSFLDSLVTHELLAVLGVILTITLASIVNVHAEITRMVRRIYPDDIARGQLQAQDIRNELNSSAWYLIGSFLGAIVVLTMKAEMKEDVVWHSGLNGAGLGTLLLMVLIMYDIHRTIFALAASSPADAPTD